MIEVNASYLKDIFGEHPNLANKTAMAAHMGMMTAISMFMQSAEVDLLSLLTPQAAYELLHEQYHRLARAAIFLENSFTCDVFCKAGLSLITYLMERTDQTLGLPELDELAQAQFNRDKVAYIAGSIEAGAKEGQIAVVLHGLETIQNEHGVNYYVQIPEEFLDAKS